MGSTAGLLSARADACVVACADAFRGDGEIVASAFGMAPRAGVALARLTFEPLLLSTNGEAFLMAEPTSLAASQPSHTIVEGYLPFRRSFEYVWSGRRHAMMMVAQLDRMGNANLSVIGDWHRPRAQLIGVRGLPGNSVNHTCSYWVPRHSRRTFVEKVDMISAVGYRPGEPDPAMRYHEIRRVVTNLCVFDFEGPENVMRVASLHPGVSLDEVFENTGFEPAIAPDLGTSRPPTAEEYRLLHETIDPDGMTLTEIERR